MEIPFGVPCTILIVATEDGPVDSAAVVLEVGVVVSSDDSLQQCSLYPKSKLSHTFDKVIQIYYSISVFFVSFLFFDFNAHTFLFSCFGGLW